jgi:predicted RecB family nuclease
MPRDYLTATDFFKYLTCPHWPYFDRFATADDKKLKRELTPGEKRRLDDGLEHEREVMEEFAEGREIRVMKETGDPKKLFAATKKAMEAGADFIYQGTLLDRDMLGRPDLLVKKDGMSDLGNWHYMPIDIKSSHELKTAHRFELTFYAALLHRVQGVFPERAGIINRDHDEFLFEPADLLADFEILLQKIQDIRKGRKPAPVVRKTCFDTGPWGAACLKFAQKTNDIALIYNVSVPKLTALRDLGIKTVEDAAAMDPSSYAGAAPGLTLHGLETIKLQAQSLLHNAVYVKKPCVFEQTPLEIHFDIESYLPDDMDYLYGFLLRQHGTDLANDGAGKYVRFLAERVQDEQKMWEEFLAWLETLPEEYLVYHYASYERMRLNILESRYHGSARLNSFRDRLVDLKIPATKNITYPLYFYSLKKICNFLGYSWRSDVKSGGESIDRYAQWLETGDRAILDDIVLYNEDDVRATAFLKDWMEENAGEAGEIG